MGFSKNKIIGLILYIECGFLLIPALIAFFNKEESFNAFLLSIIITFIFASILFIPKREQKRINTEDVLFITVMTWILMTIFAAIPLYVSGAVPTFIDAFFEIMSGFTTTGSTLIPDVESLDSSLNFLRCFTHWLGGMGIIIFTIAILPSTGINTFQMFKAEAPGPSPGRLVPKIKDTAIFTYKIYTVLTILCIICLKIAGMSLFDSIIHAFSTLGTGGYSNKNISIAYYDSPAIEYILSIFMILASLNFSLYFVALVSDRRVFKKDEEFKLFIKIVIVATLMIAIDLFLLQYHKLEFSFRAALFQVSSIISTTGFSSVNFDTFPTFSKVVLLLLMLIGGCAGSTAGGMKVVRIDTLFKVLKNEITYIFHPNAVSPIMFNGKALSNSVLRGTLSYIIMYFVVFAIGLLLIALEGYDFETVFSSVLCTISNVGPGLHAAGPTVNFSHFNQFSKMVFSMLMLLGRLEFYTVIALFSPKSLKKVN